MIPISANLGFLWQHLTLPEAIHAAHKAGFEAVECHWPYDTPPEQVNDALRETGMKMLGLNTVKGEGENGLLALPEKVEQARAAIDQALSYAQKIGAGKVHAMAGIASGAQAQQCYIENLEYACERAAPLGIEVLIEPLNHFDAPNYFLQTTSQAREIIRSVAASNLKLMFDCYHVQIMEGDICRRLTDLLPIIGHVQVASVPKRAEPDQGELQLSYVYDHLKAIGYSGAIGAEYRPSTTEGAGLGWLAKLRG
ncbi:hydroxypyruvate isomerase family protein [Falsihalocynthiibacter sp. SS001]|uniref:hydroxypyruvate isomerase family protein n=1 Tax=Falsihalocynthiibacter sp. SS001 TaxID=3349698 RepID=UPI0036D432D1